jgi:hypothetical protein
VLADPESDPEARLGMLRDFVAHASPISDLRGSQRYRSAMLLTLSQRVLHAAVAQRDRP